jgi:hypothetical protein
VGDRGFVEDVLAAGSFFGLDETCGRCVGAPEGRREEVKG